MPLSGRSQCPTEIENLISTVSATRAPRTEATVEATNSEERVTSMRTSRIPPKHELNADAAGLRHRHHRWRRSRRSKDLYAYLLSVYQLWQQWREADATEQAARRLLALAEIPASQRRHPLRAIIDSTSDADRKTKSRWTRALRFAWSERRRCRGLKKCLEANGGVAGCARRWAELRAVTRAPPGFVRLGGERAPKVPFFVDVRLLDERGRW